ARAAQALAAAGPSDLLAGARHHREAPGGMHVEEADAEPGGLDAGLRHRAGNVVEFEVEKDVAAVAVHHAHHLAARLEEELLADLEGRDLRCQQTHQALRFGEPVDVEGEDEPVSQAVGGAPDQWWPYLGPTSAATRAATSPTGTSAASAAVRGFTSTQPR